MRNWIRKLRRFSELSFFIILTTTSTSTSTSYQSHNSPNVPVTIIDCNERGSLKTPCLLLVARSMGGQRLFTTRQSKCGCFLFFTYMYIGKKKRIVGARSTKCGCWSYKKEYKVSLSSDSDTEGCVSGNHPWGRYGQGKKRE